ncbi:hypothetical protein RHSIM_Rhsim06G0158900 [Rhododendron simsii]|uniref:Ubiquitin-like domain-containing protein n=1 Tax=Rhododendron simsii TaxID=118357 RepID=A0A834GX37_RHOSS|nr:hypothetical protein RHSIM_Rhsim06G0158900 [Rhododendron simsii]
MEMKVVVEMLTGTLFFVQVSDNATVADLKREIGAQENLPHDRLILILGGDLTRLVNENDISLVDYGIRDWSHVYLILAPLIGDGSSNNVLSPSLFEENNWSTETIIV